MLCRLGNYPGARISVTVAAVLADIPVARSRELLAGIYRRGLLTPERDGGYRMHDLVRVAAQRRTVTDDSLAGQREADNRLFAYVGEALAHVNHSAYPIGRGPYRPWPASQAPTTAPIPVVESAGEALSWLDAHLADLLAITRRAIALQWSQAWWLCLGLEYHLRVHGFYQQAREIAAAGLGIADQRHDLLGMAVTHDLLGVLEFRVGMYDGAQSHLQSALMLFERLDNARGQAEVLYELGVVARLAGEYTEARSRQRQALVQYKTLGIEHITGPSRRELGTLDRLEGRYDTAREHLSFALNEAMLTGDPGRQARAHTELGALDRAMGGFSSAREHLAQAVALYKNHGDPPRQAETHRELGMLASSMNDHRAALHHLEAALATYRELNNRHRQAGILTQLADVAAAQGDRIAADRYRSEAISLYDLLGQCSEADKIRNEISSRADPAT